jgi:hypothetical protein
MWSTRPSHLAPGRRPAKRNRRPRAREGLAFLVDSAYELRGLQGKGWARAQDLASIEGRSDVSTNYRSEHQEPGGNRQAFMGFTL